MKKNNFKCHCDICNINVPYNRFKKHLKLQHNFTDVEAFIEQELHTNSIFKGIIPKDILKVFLLRINQTGRYKIHKDAILTFYKSITLYREFKNEDINLFFDKFLPWKLEHKCQGNNREQCDIIFYDNKEFANKLYNDTMLSKNPYHNHNGKFSPYSNNFIGYVGLDQKEIEERKKKARHDDIRLNPVNVEYWINKGYSEDEAVELVHKRQQTFSLEKCIDTYGPEEGYKRWKDRQNKWQQTLNSKSPDEKSRINRKKVFRNGNTSKKEYKFLMSILPDESYHNVYINETGSVVDLFYKNKIIEFYGDYWHCNPRDPRFPDNYYNKSLHMTAKEKREFDNNRILKLKQSGYEIKIVWEMDYDSNPDKTILECKEFIGVN